MSSAPLRHRARGLAQLTNCPTASYLATADGCKAELAPAGCRRVFASWAVTPRALSSDAKRQRQEANAVGAEVVAEGTSGAQHQKQPGNNKSDAAARHERDDDTRTEVSESQTVEHRPAGSTFEPSESQETYSQDKDDHVESTTTKVQTEQEGDSVREVTTRVKVAKWKSDMLDAE